MRELVLAKIATIREESDNFRGSRWTALSCMSRRGIDIRDLNFDEIPDEELLPIFERMLYCLFKQR